MALQVPNRLGDSPEHELFDLWPDFQLIRKRQIRLDAMSWEWRKEIDQGRSQPCGTQVGWMYLHQECA